MVEWLAGIKAWFVRCVLWYWSGVGWKEETDARAALGEHVQREHEPTDPNIVDDRGQL